MLGPQARGVDHVAVLGDVLGDRLDLLVRVAEVLQRPRHGLVDDLHGAAADQLLELDQGQVGLDAGGVAVHHQPDGVVADEAVGDVGDVVGDGDVVGELLVARLGAGDGVVDEPEQVTELRVGVAPEQLGRQAARDRALAGLHQQRSAQLVVVRGEAVDELRRHGNAVAREAVVAGVEIDGVVLAMADEADLVEPRLVVGRVEQPQNGGGCVR